jgi:hypothetical protein
MKYTVEGKLVFTFDGTVDEALLVARTMRECLDKWKIGEIPKDTKVLGLGQHYDILDENGKSIVKVKED